MVLVRRSVVVLLLAACGGREPAPSPDAPATAPPVTAPSAAAAPEPSRAPAPDPYAVYTVADADVRRDTYLKGAALILPNPAEDMVQTLFAESGVRYARLAADERFGQYECGGVSEDVARPWVILSARHLAVHAPTLLRASGLRWVVFCAGLNQRGQPRSAVPAASGGILIVDALTAGPEAFFQGTIHHELFHILDYAERRLWADAEWSRLNPAGTSYGSGGRASRNASGRLGTGSAGFVTAYAQSAVEEDKAEMFRFLVLDPEGLAALAARDAAIAAKRDLMLRRLAPVCADRPHAAVCRERAPG